MTWDGRPENPERTTAHWIEDKSLKHVCCVVWCHVMQQWHDMAVQMPPRGAAKWWRYLGPCLTPQEVAEREAIAEHNALHSAEASAREQAAREKALRECVEIAKKVRQAGNECAREPDLIANIRREYLAQARGAEDVEEAILALIEKEPT